jgi:5-methylcytosine-specific restriction protein A
MQTFLLTWNPRKSSWDKLDADYEHIREHGFLDAKRSCGRNKHLRVGDRVFLLRQGSEPRGIVASGSVMSSEPFIAEHWSKRGRSALYVNARLDVLLHPDREPVCPRSRLNSGAMASVHWDTQSSGIKIPPDAAAELEELWRAFLIERGYSPIVLADEVPAAERFWEGALRRISVNAYERDATARRACIAHFGAACRVCGFDFGATYGELGSGFIHVHHTHPLSDVRTGYAVDPKRDLIPVCPNCHAMLHQTSPPLTVAELQKRL